MKSLLSLCAALVLTVGVTAAEKVDCKCPVSGAPAKASSSVEFDGGKVYFCCNNCPNAFEANTKKFADEAHAQMVKTGEAIQVACPFSGGPIDSSTEIAVGQATVAFCCGNCKAKAEGADDPVALVFSNFEKGFTTQTKCPVSGKKIDVDQSVSYKGEKVYFCCPNCPAAFKKNPEKFESKLPQLED